MRFSRAVMLLPIVAVAVQAPATVAATASHEAPRSAAVYSIEPGSLVPDDPSRAVGPAGRPVISGDGSTLVVSHGNSWRVGPQSGNSTIFVRSGGRWVQQGPTIVPTDLATATGFGGVVALSNDGNTAIFGGSIDGVSDAGSHQHGAAWIYVRSNGRWREDGPKLTSPGGYDGFGEFGVSVALSANGKTALIGDAGSHNGNGSAWIFVRTASGWVRQGPEITGVTSPDQAQLGFAVALSGNGDVASIDARYDHGGSITTFVRSGASWRPLGARLLQTKGADFGFSLSLSSDGRYLLASGGPAGANTAYQRTVSGWKRFGPALVSAKIYGSVPADTAPQLAEGGSVAFTAAWYNTSGGPRGGAAVYTRTADGWVQSGPELIGLSIDSISADGRIAVATIGGRVDVIHFASPPSTFTPLPMVSATVGQTATVSIRDAKQQVGVGDVEVTTILPGRAGRLTIAAWNDQHEAVWTTRPLPRGITTVTFAIGNKSTIFFIRAS